MTQKPLQTTRILPMMLALCLALGLAGQASVARAQGAATPAAPADVTITVDRSDDPDSDSRTKTCGYDAGIYNPSGDGCSLRQALLEAGARPAADRPIAIEFNLASDDPGYDADSDTWTVTIDDQLALKPDSILAIDGQVTLDGDTQPGGRSDGPKVYIQTNDNSLLVEMENNVIRNLAFIGGGVIFLRENGNTVEDVTMGLSRDGQSIVLREPANPRRLAGGGVNIASDDNIVRNNTIAGAFDAAVRIDGGDNNLVENNLIGTRADGTVPMVPEALLCLRSFNFDPDNWYGGWGINLSGSGNQILNNRIAGLHILQSANDTPPRAMEIFGANHRIEGNIIGLDSANTPVGVCGQGIKVSGSDTEIVDNIIVGSRTDSEDAEPAAILASDTSPLFGQITVRRNRVSGALEKAYGFGPGIPDSLRFFAPAQVTNVTETTVSGSSGEESPCPNCIVDVYVDDLDAAEEALAHVGSTTADGDGNWSLDLDQPLPDNRGIRTGSTAQNGGIIGTFGAGTSTKLSTLYVVPVSLRIDGPTAGDIGSQYQFDLTTQPLTDLEIYDYSIAVTDRSTPLAGTFGSLANARLSWSSPGVKTIEVTVETSLGTVTESFQITIEDNTPEPEPSDEILLFLPLTGR